MEHPSSGPHFSHMETEQLKFWQDRDIFNRQNTSRNESPEFTSYDGPPFANGLPHYGHILASTIKDTVLRYWVMKGFRVDRRFGWDCHGLPVEFEVEKQLGLKGRKSILDMGVEAFNQVCRESVDTYVQEWRKTITRLGRWVDWDHQYRTMDKEFMESVWWVFKELYAKGLVYKGFKVVPFSPRTGSVVSNFEANQNYKMVQDPSVIVKFTWRDVPDTHFLAWTTTPWTLPSNAGLAVHKEVVYVMLKEEATGQTYVLAKDRVAFFVGKFADKQTDHYKECGQKLGSELVGIAYESLFPDLEQDTNQKFRVWAADFVTTDSGTGVVHLAPAFGEEDYYVCVSQGISLFDPTDENGCFTKKLPAYEGMYFKDADKLIIKDLKARGLLLRHETIDHSYPFDERTDTPLMYKAVPSWYVAVETFVPDLVACNEQIHWVPGHLKDGRMGSWLKQARDWSISRNRFWGTPLPVWVCIQDEHHVFVAASAKDLAQASGQPELEDVHLHCVSEVSLPCLHCDGRMRHIGLVFDCWFESGSMPYAQVGYPRRSKEDFLSRFPADFIAEGLDQTRGWFYSLSVLSAALFKTPAFKHVIVNGVILDERGKKMSKRHKNYTPPDALMDTYGSDSIRLYLLNSPLLRAEDLIFSDKGVLDTTRSVLLPLWNALSFFATYAQADGWKPTAALVVHGVTRLEEPLDRWMVSKLHGLIHMIELHMKNYTLYQVVPGVLGFIEDLTNWYIRLNRRRFWGGANESTKAGQEAAYETLFYVLLEFSKIFAPFAPFLSETLYRRLVEMVAEAPESVHLCDYPLFNPSLREVSLEAEMEDVRVCVNLARGLRQQFKIKTRQVLPSVTVVLSEHARPMDGWVDLLKTELNVQQVYFTRNETDHVYVSFKPNLKQLGKRLGKDLPKLVEHVKCLHQDQALSHGVFLELTQGRRVVMLGNEFSKEDFLVERTPKDDRLMATQGEMTVLLDTQLTPALMAEGVARECVNRIQNLRKSAGLNVSDRILLELGLPEAFHDPVHSFLDYIQKETLAVNARVLLPGAQLTLKYQESTEIHDHMCEIALAKA